MSVEQSREPTRDLTGIGLGALVFVVALALRWIAIGATGFDGLYGQDPFAYFDYSRELSSALRSFAAPPPFHWPIGYPLLVALVMAGGDDAAAAGQLASIVAATAAAVLAYALVRELRPAARAGAFVAGVLAATASQLMISSLSVMSDAAALAWLTLSAWALVRHQRALGRGSLPSRSAAWLALAALAFAAATLTRWASLFAAPAFAASALLAWREAGIPGRAQVATAVAVLLLVAVVVGLPLVPDLGSGDLRHVGDFRQVGWSPRNAFRSTITSSDGVLRYERPVGLYYALPPVHPSFVFPLLSPFVLLGAIAMVRERRSLLALFVGWPLSVYLVLAGIAWENPRLSLTLFPPLLVLLGVGFDRAVRSPYRRSAITCAALGLLGSLLWCARDVRRFTGIKQAHLDAVRWAEGATPQDATIISFGLTETLRHYTDRRIANLYALSPGSIARLAASRAPVYLLVDPVNLEDQWRGRSPETNLRWLEKRAILAEVSRRPPWILYAVGAPRGEDPPRLR